MTTNDSLGGLAQFSRVIAETASDAIITIDEQSTILFVNRASEKIFGYSRDELIGQSLTMLMPDYLRHVHLAGLKRYLTTGKRHLTWDAIELPGLHKDGHHVPLEVSFGEIVEGNKRFFTGFARDITDRKRAEEALKESEEHLRALIENSTDIITVLNEDGIQYVSPSVERSIGYRPEELIGKDPIELVHPDDAVRLRKLFAAGVKHPGFLVTKQLRIRHKDGSWRIHEATVHNLLNDSAVRGIVINSRDISDRKRLERRLTVQYEAARILAESDSLNTAAPKLLQAICESLGWDLGQIWIVDREANLLRWLTSWRDPSVSVSEFEEASRGRPFARGVGLPGVIWADGNSRWMSNLATDPNFTRQALAEKAGLHSAFGFPIKLGDEVSGVIEFFTREPQAPDPTLLEGMTPIGNQIGQFVERKHAEEERAQVFAREQRARLELETAMDRMRQVQTVTEVALSYLSVDKLLAELLDRVRDAMDVDSVVILLLEEQDNSLVAWAAKGLDVDLGIRVPFGAGFAGRVAEQKKPVSIDDTSTADLFTPFLRDKGVKCLLGVPLLIEGRVLGVIHVGRFTHRPFTEDDTRLLQLVAFRVALAIDNARLFEEERAARREAEAANRAKDEFLTTLSHELRTPLTPVIGWIHMVRSGMLPGKQLEHGLSVIEKNAHALKRLINDLLDMTAILSGKMRMEELPVHLGQVVSEAVETVRPSAAARDIHLDIAFHDWHDELVSGDSTRLGQVFANLLNNAVKFSSRGSHVRVICTAEGADAVVKVEDEGQGISKEFLPFVFERFLQADGSKTRAHGGLGLGLALVKSFVEAQGGTVQAESPGLGQGSRFTVRLPKRAATAAVAVGEKQTTGPLVKPDGAHILIVEDDEDTLELLQSTFKSKGFRVTTCQSAKEALQMAPANSIDLILSDIGMPHMDGFEMMRELRQLPDMQDVPAIALSGYASQKDTRMSLAAGFNAHLSKPIEPAELLRTINRLLKKTASVKPAR